MRHRKTQVAPARFLSEGRKSQPFPRGPGPPDRRSQSARYHAVKGYDYGTQPASFNKAKYSLFAQLSRSREAGSHAVRHRLVEVNALTSVIGDLPARRRRTEGLNDAWVRAS